jgi:hypothetical protein
MRIYIVFFLILLTCISCGKKSPVSPGSEEVGRNGTYFEDPVMIFPDAGGGIFCDADISEIVRGPGMLGEQWGTLWEDPIYGEHWSVAVALREVPPSTNGVRQICYRFISEDGDMSPVFDAPYDPGIIRLARVDACYITGPPGLLNTIVEVCIVFQFWTQVAGTNYSLWRIGICRMAFDPNTICSGGTFLRLTSDITSLIPDDTPGLPGSNYDVPDYGQMMPDIAYDPRSATIEDGNGKGDFYIVFTFYNALSPPGRDGPHVYMKYCRRNGDSFGTVDYNQETCPVPIQKLPAMYGLGLCYGYHPRIDIGEVTFFPGLQPPWNVTDWHAAVAFTADNSVFGPHLSYWHAGYVNEGSWSDDSFTELPLRFYGDNSKAGFMPSIDIGPPHTDLCSVVWTQARSESWNDVCVGYVDTHFGVFFFDEIQGKGYLESTAFPSVAVLSDLDTGDNEVYANITYLHSFNPSSLKWVPSAVQIETDYTNVGIPVNTLGLIFNLSDDFYGSYDSGSQWSNWYGMSSSTAVLTDNGGNDWFLSLWSTIGQNQFNLNTVYGTRGFTTAPL